MGLIGVSSMFSPDLLRIGRRAYGFDNNFKINERRRH